jgi:hypothetical protein
MNLFISNSFLQKTPCVITDQDLPNLIFSSIHPFRLLVKHKVSDYIKYGLKYGEDTKIPRFHLGILGYKNWIPVYTGMTDGDGLLRQARNDGICRKRARFHFLKILRSEISSKKFCEYRKNTATAVFLSCF